MAAVTAPAACVAVAATAGSGKTRVLVERIRHLVKLGADPRSVACVTFTTEAAREIQNRLNDGDGRAIHLGYAGTLHGLMLRAIQVAPIACGYFAAPAVANKTLADAMLEEALVETRCRESLKVVRHIAATALPRNRALNKVESCVAHYHQKLVDCGLVDYDSILRLGLELLRARRWPLTATHLLVDEVQDSSGMDAAIYEAFPVRNKFFVGDEDQAIYSFRGGSPKHLRDMIARHGVKVMQDCYRCSEEICVAAENVVRRVAGRVPKRTVSVRGPHLPVTVSRFAGHQQELASIATMIHRHAEDGSAPLEQVAVLLRSNALVALFRDGLLAHGIKLRSPAESLAAADWTTAQTIVAMCAAPHNDRLLLAVVELTGGPERAAALQRQAAEQMGTVYEAYGVKIEPTLPAALQHMVLAGIGRSTMESVEALASRMDSPSLHDLALAMQHERPCSEAQAGVHVGTMHSAKGLEWNDVYLPAFEQAIIPAKRDIDDERRLAFVAFTRARNRLVLSHCAERPGQFGRRDMEPAQPSQLIEEAGL